MRSTGIVRKLDNFGRIVMPMELRKSLGISDSDPIEFFVEGDTIVLRKYCPSCVFCGSADNTFSFEGKVVCEKCAKRISTSK